MYPVVRRFCELYRWEHQGVEHVVTYDIMHQCEAIFTRLEWETKAVQIIRLTRFPYIERME